MGNIVQKNSDRSVRKVSKVKVDSKRKNTGWSQDQKPKTINPGLVPVNYKSDLDVFLVPILPASFT